MKSYIREDSDGDISFERCTFCGCMIVWWGVGKWAGPEHKAGINCRMLPETEMEGIVKVVSPGPPDN